MPIPVVVEVIDTQRDDKIDSATFIVVMEAEIRKQELREQPAYTGGWFSDWLDQMEKRLAS